MIARPKISRDEWKTTEIGGSEVGNFALLSCPGYALEDVPEVLRVGQLYRGCLRAPALDPVAVDADGARRAMSETALEPPPRYPLYFVAGADAGSQAMRDAFVGGLRDDWDLRERRPGDLHPTAAVEGQGRWLCRMQPLVWVVRTKLENALARSHRSRFG